MRISRGSRDLACVSSVGEISAMLLHADLGLSCETEEGTKQSH